jgi:ATP-dependent exoDNAse (exonuclease V) beta subunit
MAAMLASMGIPAYADTGGSLFRSLEVRDVLAALKVMDCLQQDIPLAAVHDPLCPPSEICDWDSDETSST